MKNFWHKLKKPILVLAPMAGITDSPFRILCKNQGADVMYTEMTSADGLAYKGKKTLELLNFSGKQRPVVLQLFGKDPEKFGQALEVIKTLPKNQQPDGIDINFGCPAKKVTRHGGGVTLMRNLSHCREIIQAACEHSAWPVSVKIRSSINSLDKKNKVTALDFINYVKDLPITTIMIHGRPFENPFQAEIDFEMIQEAKKIFPGIIIANGGIITPEKAKEMLKKTGADGIALARGLYGKPWLFKQIKNYLKNDKYQELPWPRIKKIALKHAALNYQAKGDHGILEMRKYLCFYTKGLPSATGLRQKLVRVKTVGEIKKILK
jgi:tRNA-dihydrouridine synthase B